MPPAGIIHTAMAMGDGARKYGPYNWREKDVKARVYVAAALRHLLQWLDGEDEAQDSGVNHLAHASACCFILMDAQENGCLEDDRPRPGKSPEIIKRLTTEVKKPDVAQV